MSNYAAPIRILQTDFRSGQIDPTLAMRVDSKAYPSGARSLKNMLLRSTGAVERRPGMTRLVALNQRSRLIGFEYDSDEKYELAFGAAHLRIYNPDGTAVQTFTGSTDCPWTADTIWEITYTQLGDKMFICHPDFKPKILTRTSLSTFTMSDYAFDTEVSNSIVSQPYIKYETAATTLAISNTAIGTGRTLTSSPGIFSAAWVGDRIRIFDCEILITGYTNATTCTASVLQKIRQKLDPQPLRGQEGSGVIEVTQAYHGLATGASVTIEGADTLGSGGGGVDLGVGDGQVNGARTITVIDADHWEFTAGGGDVVDRSGDGGGTAVYIYSTAATRQWTEQVFSTRRGWPSAVALHENRLWFGGSLKGPTLLAGSSIGAYYDFDLRDGEDDASILTSVISSQFGRIRHLVSSDGLQIFTETSEIAIRTEQGQPITPSDIRATSRSTYGTGNVRPIPFDGSTVFAQASGRVVREMIYDFNVDGYLAPSLSTASSNLVKNPIDAAVLRGSDTRSEQYLFYVNNDGTVSIFHSVRSEDLAAWSPLETFAGHEIDSVCCIGTSVYLSVKVGSTYYLNRLELDETDIWLDNAKSMTGASTVTWALGATYANETVSVMSNGHYIGDFTANGSGTITLDEAVTDIVAGYDYGIEIIPMPPDKEINDGPLTGEIRRIVSVTAHFHETVNATVNGKPWIGLSIGDDLSEPPVEFTGKKRFRLLGYNRDPDFTIAQDAPGKLTLLGFSTEVSI